jgi:hypothetical protein
VVSFLKEKKPAVNMLQARKWTMHKKKNYTLTNTPATAVTQLCPGEKLALIRSNYNVISGAIVSFSFCLRIILS